VNSPNTVRKRQVHFDIPLKNGIDPEMQKELSDIIEAKEAGIAYVLGHSYVKAKKSSPWLKRFAINYVYTFLQRNCREPAKALHIPHASLIEVGMVYYV
jgi:KUP system potassium uptake protein